MSVVSRFALLDIYPRPMSGRSSAENASAASGRIRSEGSTLSTAALGAQ